MHFVVLGVEQVSHKQDKYLNLSNPNIQPYSTKTSSFERSGQKIKEKPINIKNAESKLLFITMDIFLQQLAYISFWAFIENKFFTWSMKISVNMD